MRHAHTTIASRLLSGLQREMEILAGVACAVLVNAACMAHIMKWQAQRIRGWEIRSGESLGVQVRASLAGALCVLFGVLLISALPGLFGSNALPDVAPAVDLGLALAGFFVPYYFWLRHIAFRLARSQLDRGRGVVKRNVHDIARATFVSAFALYALAGAAAWLWWRTAGGH